MTLLCCPITVNDADDALAACGRAAEAGADLVEFRCDRFTDDRDALARLVADASLPCIVTLRHASEGGGFSGLESLRVGLLLFLSQQPRPPAYLDFEHARLAALSAGERADLEDAATRCGLILSTHDFAGRPADLDRRVLAMADTPGVRVLKAAWAARSLRDNLQAFELIERRLAPTAALCMGDAGLPSRVLARKFGGFVTFAAADRASGTAPGQPTIAELRDLYRWDAIGPATRVYGVIGDPVGHSKSPALHNAGFDASGFDGVYLPMPIPAGYEHLKATLSAWLDHGSLRFRGASVTIPHKADLLRFAEERGATIDPLAARIGAANTLIVGEDGALAVRNTDCDAALGVVRRALGGVGLRGAAVAVLGAGGVSRAVVAGFADAGCRVTVFNRSVERARSLAAAFGVEAAPLAEAAAGAADVWINATSIGMETAEDPAPDASPLPDPPGSWGPGTVVFDTVYTPPETRLLRDAAAAGCVTAGGTAMFLAQAAAQFEAWTGVEAPEAVFGSGGAGHPAGAIEGFAGDAG
ncbi:type I 3-dehydroquinate dehydratase [Phycisphaera mikurensis]|uniref:Shikimate dehydrogenase (NADP(+)) n=1 Tax=Phycisphaera mikurensis (strain NBRC 102666 / KCTC 22515 / FYK2301M01) TaxID=1142394 RepID=I0IBS2_PHYMF|nr:type I 3-dehydroquinate dehydratase [Phycisphaera mikurensis]MBB6442058.1 3-dehydroquinate dehydratase/shikimate dehydrogenase [Phycisphaera mikurensis]BAM02710.1 3-dehydroquinate dehydratase/shikimate dehydrogenase [Phycisphaera mikurensis NBRC 102666]